MPGNRVLIARGIAGRHCGHRVDLEDGKETVSAQPDSVCPFNEITENNGNIFEEEVMNTLSNYYPASMIYPLG